MSVQLSSIMNRGRYEFVSVDDFDMSNLSDNTTYFIYNKEIPSPAVTTPHTASVYYLKACRCVQVVDGVITEVESITDGNGNVVAKYFGNITFQWDPNVSAQSIKVPLYAKYSEYFPETPTRDDGFVFDGWYIGDTKLTGDEYIEDGATVVARWDHSVPYADSIVGLSGLEDKFITTPKWDRNNLDTYTASFSYDSNQKLFRINIYLRYNLKTKSLYQDITVSTFGLTYAHDGTYSSISSPDVTCKDYVAHEDGEYYRWYTLRGYTVSVPVNPDLNSSMTIYKDQFPHRTVLMFSDVYAGKTSTLYLINGSGRVKGGSLEETVHNNTCTVRLTHTWTGEEGTQWVVIEGGWESISTSPNSSSSAKTVNNNTNNVAAILVYSAPKLRNYAFAGTWLGQSPMVIWNDVTLGSYVFSESLVSAILFGGVVTTVANSMNKVSPDVLYIHSVSSFVSGWANYFGENTAIPDGSDDYEFFNDELENRKRAIIIGNITSSSKYCCYGSSSASIYILEIMNANGLVATTFNTLPTYILIGNVAFSNIVSTALSGYYGDVVFTTVTGPELINYDASSYNYMFGAKGFSDSSAGASFYGCDGAMFLKNSDHTHYLDFYPYWDLLGALE